MSAELAAAVLLITAALLLYSVGVWAERLRRRLRWWHVACFAGGLACDASGTGVMVRLAAAHPAEGGSSPLITVMGVTGTAAIMLMAVHLVWAAIVLLRGDESARSRFHRLSLTVWLIWLVPYVAGAVGANLR